MAWEKVSVDSIVDYKESNRKTLGDLLAFFDKVMCVFNDMKAESIKLDQCLQSLKQTVINEGEVVPASVNYFNTALVNYTNALNILLSLKVPSESGIAAFIVKPWSATATQYSASISFKMSQYNWVNCADHCEIDNMIVTTPAVNCPGGAVSVEINIGCTLVSIPQADIATITYADFCTLLCSGTPANLHQLIAHFNKNIALVEKCVSHISHLVETFELL